MNNFYISLKKILNFLLIICIIAAIIYISFTIFKHITNKNDLPISPSDEDMTAIDANDDTIEEAKQPELHVQSFTVGDFGPDQERKDYKSGSIKLYIPKIGYTGPVLSVDMNTAFTEGEENGLEYEDVYLNISKEMNAMLDLGVVLFNEAQLPGAENRNVSIAGHRDAANMEFLKIDTLSAGDQMYLIYNGNVYIYTYEKTVVTDETDWAPVAIQEKSVITLQSCDPPYSTTGYDRMFVTGILTSIVKEDGFNIPIGSNTDTEEQSSSQFGLSEVD